MAGVKVINNVSGLGTVFIKRGPLTALVTQLYRFALRGSSTIFFHNRDDMQLFVGKRIAQRTASPCPRTARRCRAPCSKVQQ